MTTGTKSRKRKTWKEVEKICKAEGCGKKIVSKWSMCDDCREKRQAYLPSPEEIEAECLRIREEQDREKEENGSPQYVVRMPKVYKTPRGLR